MRYLGKISYSIYLYQQVVVYPAMKLASGSRVLGVIAAIVVTIAFAMGSWYVVEQPFLRLRRRFA
jgi:peptidoglycan/LPS O-acetylase OafA/YrhL